MCRSFGPPNHSRVACQPSPDGLGYFLPALRASRTRALHRMTIDNEPDIPRLEIRNCLATIDREQGAENVGRYGVWQRLRVTVGESSHCHTGMEAGDASSPRRIDRHWRLHDVQIPWL